MKIHYKYRNPNTITNLLESCRTIAVVGLSSRENRAGYYVPAYMQRQGYRIIPVNPHLSEALGEKAYPDLASIPEAVDMVLIFRRSEEVAPIVEEAIQVGAKAVWTQLGVVDTTAMQQAEQSGLAAVMNACIMVEHRSRY